MKKVACLLCGFMFVSTLAFAGAWDNVDKESKQVKDFVWEIINPGFTEEVQKTYPDATFEVDARPIQSSSETSSTYLVSIGMTDDRGREIGYHYIELTFSFVNGDPVLCEKYGIEIK